MGKLVSLDIPDEEFEEAMQQLEKEEKWRAENPEKHKAIEIIVAAIVALEELQEAVRNS